jgi:hypothetical protein
LRDYYYRNPNTIQYNTIQWVWLHHYVFTVEMIGYRNSNRSIHVQHRIHNKWYQSSMHIIIFNTHEYKYIILVLHISVNIYLCTHNFISCSKFADLWHHPLSTVSQATGLAACILLLTVSQVTGLAPCILLLTVSQVTSPRSMALPVNPSFTVF